MKDIGIKYIASIFGDFDKIEVNSENVYRLMGIFKEEHLIPSTMQEAIINGNNIPVVVVRPRLSTINNEISIEIMTNRIDVELRSLDKIIVNEENFERFIEKASDYIERVCNGFNVKGNRLAINTDEIIVDNLNNKKVNDLSPNEKINLFKDNEIYEWTTQSVVRNNVNISNGKSEEINIILSLSKNDNITLNEGGLRVSVDINTVPNNTEMRFGFESGDSTKELFGELLQKRKEVIRDLRGRISD